MSFYVYLVVSCFVFHSQTWHEYGMNLHNASNRHSTNLKKRTSCHDRMPANPMFLSVFSCLKDVLSPFSECNRKFGVCNLYKSPKNIGAIWCGCYAIYTNPPKKIDILWYTMKVAAHHVLSIPVQRCPVLLAVSCVRVTSLKLRGLKPGLPCNCGLRWKTGKALLDVEQRWTRKHHEK